MPVTIYIALGTNLGDRLANLQAARQALSPQVKLLACSTIYETPPWGYLDQPAFLNQVVKGETSISPQDLLAFLKRLETQLGRRPAVRYGPRLIDLDLLFYGSRVLETPDLAIPHPRLAERAFVLVPLAELAPDLRHPILESTMQELLEKLDTTGITPYRE